MRRQTTFVRKYAHSIQYSRMRGKLLWNTWKFFCEIRASSEIRYTWKFFRKSQRIARYQKCIIKTFPRRYESIPYQILLSILNRQMHNLSIVLGTVSKLSGTVSKLSGTVSKLSGTVSKLSFDASDHCLGTRSTLPRGVLRINQSC